MMPAVNSFERLLQDLERAGLWRGVSHAQALALRTRLQSGQDATWSFGGAWRADGEDLAEGDVEEWLRGMAEPLNGCGVQLVVATCSSPHDRLGSYAVKVNGETLGLYSVDPSDLRQPLAFDPWLDCTIRPAAEVNRLLSVLGPESVLREAAVPIQAVDGASAFVVPRRTR